MSQRANPRPGVLVVDDHALLRQILRELLEYGGYVVEEAADGCAALARIRAADGPLVVLLDYYLPGLTGEQVLDALASEAREEKGAGARRVRGCILMSTLPEAVAPVAARHQVALLAKPFTPDEMLQTVARVGVDAAHAWG